MNDETSTLAVPVSADDHRQGDDACVVTLVEYGDFQCPACAAAHPVVKQMLRHYQGNLCFVFRHFPMSQVHPLAHPAARLAESAATLERFWEVHGWLYENQSDWTPYGASGLEQAARELRLDEAALIEVAQLPSTDARIRQDFMGGVRSGVNGTPCFFVNGRRHEGDFDALARVIGHVIAQRR